MTPSSSAPDPVWQNRIAARPADRPGRAPRWQGQEVAVLAVALVMGFMLRYVATEHLIFAGADSYSYTSAASELREHHRYGFPACRPGIPSVRPRPRLGAVARPVIRCCWPRWAP